MAEEKRFVDSELFCRMAEGSCDAWEKMLAASVLHKNLGNGKIIEIKPRKGNPPQVVVQFKERNAIYNTGIDSFPLQITSIEVDESLAQQVEHLAIKEERAARKRAAEEQRQKKEQQKQKEEEQRRREEAVKLRREQREKRLQNEAQAQRRLERLEEIKEIPLYYRVLPKHAYMDERACVFYRVPYRHGKSKFDQMIFTFKNTYDTKSPIQLNTAGIQLRHILRVDFGHIRDLLGWDDITVAVVPRSKEDLGYTHRQLMFRENIGQVVRRWKGFTDGTKYIIRTVDTYTTHLKSKLRDNNGEHPRRGLLEDTCTISNKVRGKNILLVDDVYTHYSNGSPGIDEDAIQALRNHGANLVVLYTITGAVSKHKRLSDLDQKTLRELI